MLQENYPHFSIGDACAIEQAKICWRQIINWNIVKFTCALNYHNRILQHIFIFVLKHFVIWFHHHGKWKLHNAEAKSKFNDFSYFSIFTAVYIKLSNLSLVRVIISLNKTFRHDIYMTWKHGSWLKFVMRQLKRRHKEEN